MTDEHEPLSIELRLEEVEDAVSALEELLMRLAESYVVHAAIGIPGSPIEQATYQERMSLLTDARNIAGEIRRLRSN